MVVEEMEGRKGEIPLISFFLCGEGGRAHSIDVRRELAGKSRVARIEMAERSVSVCTRDA